MMPYRLILFFFFMDYVRPGAYVPALNILHLGSLALYSAALLSLTGKQGMSNDVLFRDINTKLLGFFLFLLVLSIFASESSMLAFTTARALFEYILLYIAIAKQGYTIERLKGIFLTIVLANMAVAILTPSLFTSGERLNLASGNFLGDSNDFALSVNVAITLCLFLVFESKARFRLLMVGALLFLVLAVIVTQSRGGTLALMAVAFYYWLRGTNKIRTALLALVGVAIVIALAPASYWQRMNDLTNTKEGSAQGRLEAWQAGWRMALDNPVFGIGAGRFSFAYGSHYRLSPNTPYQTAHSIYFLNLGELGFPGLFILVAIIAANLVANARVARILRTRDPSTSLTDRRLLASLSTAMWAYAIGGAFLSAVYFPHLYVIAGLSTAARHLVRERASATTTASPNPASEPQVHIHWALRPAPARSAHPVRVGR